MTEPAHILVVDDDPSIRRMMQLLFADAGYRVSISGSGEEALAYLDLVTPDLIVMDLMLPGISGQEVTERIKADPHRPFIPIILVTARMDQQSKITGLDAGADDFLVKPVDFGELLARTRVMLRLQRSQRSLRAEQRKTELLLHLSRELNTSLDLDELLTHFLQQLANAVGATRASIILTTESRPRFYSSSTLKPTVAIEEILRDGIAGWVLRERRPANIRDTRNDTRWKMTTVSQRLVRSAAAVPITRDERSLGAITLVHHRPNYFTDEHLELLESVAVQSAIAVEHADLFRLTRIQNALLERRAQELERINQVGQHLTELMSPDQLLRLVCHLIHYTFGYPLVMILLHDQTTSPVGPHDLVVHAVTSTMRVDIGIGTRIPAGQGIVGWVTQHQEPLNVADVRQDPRNYALGEDESVRAELAVPIQTAREVFGALAVMSDAQGAFDTNDMRLLTTLASQLGVALDNSRLFATEKRRVRQLSQVNHLSVAITAQLDPTENLQIAADAIAAIFGIERCAIVVHGGDQSRPSRIAPRMRPPVVLGARLHFAPPAEHIARALNLREPLLIPRVADDERLAGLYASLEQEGIESLALVPLLSSSRLVGTMVLDVTGRIDQFEHAELTLLETVASLIAQVIENARLYRQVEDERSTLNAVLDSAADPIMLISPQEQLLLANRAATEQLGIDSTGEQPVTALIEHRELLQALHLKNGPLASNGLSPEVTLPDGETFSISVAPVRGANNETLGRVAVMQNITAIKELERREQERLRSVFGRYVSAQVVEQVLAGGGDFGEPVERDVVVIFADLRGYTTLTEGMEPRVLVEQVLNRYFTAMTDVFYRYEGTVDKFLGDGIIGVFGTPIAHPDDLPRSLCAAVDLQRAFADLRRDWQQAIGLDIGLGIGIGYGRAVVGNIGSSQRLDYTVIGDVVNTANRLNGQAAAGQIIVSYHLVDSLPPSWTSPWPLRPLSRVSLKGKQEPHLIYEIAYTDACL